MKHKHSVAILLRLLCYPYVSRLRFLTKSAGHTVVGTGTALRTGQPRYRGPIAETSPPKGSDRLWGPPSRLYNDYRGHFPRDRAAGHKLTTPLHLVARLRISGAILLLSEYAFMAGTGTNLS
jgi:hypothetical protein